MNQPQEPNYPIPSDLLTEIQSLINTIAAIDPTKPACSLEHVANHQNIADLATKYAAAISRMQTEQHMATYTSDDAEVIKFLADQKKEAARDRARMDTNTSIGVKTQDHGQMQPQATGSSHDVLGDLFTDPVDTADRARDGGDSTVGMELDEK